MREITIADKSGFCFGVKRAVKLALEYREKYNKQIYTLGQLIHNNDAVEFLRSKGVNSIELDELNSLNEGDVIIIRSHGISLKVLELLNKKGLIVVDATCPYVSQIQNKVQKYYELGYGIVIVGDYTHPEVIGINGHCNDEAIISKDGSDISELPSKVCIVSQTTEKQENWEKVIGVLAKKCKEFIAFNTICNATETRQQAADELSKKVDAMIVIGGRHSSNTTKLYEISKKNCENTIFVENANEIPSELIRNSNRIGVTAGASTPDWIIKEAVIKMNKFKDLETEDLKFNEQLEFMDENDVQVAVGDTVKGEIISLNEKEAFINIGYKKDAVLPLKEVDLEENANMKDIFNLGDEIEAKVISLKNQDGYVVLSKIEIEREKAFKELQEAYENKTEINISIKEAVKGGIIGRYKGVRVFVPASHIELFHVDNLESYVGKDLNVNIIEYKVQKRGTKIVASRRDILMKEKAKMEEEAWESLEEGQILEGEIKRITDFGAFVDVKGIDGLLHVSEISWGRIEKPQDVLKVGEKIKVSVLKVDKINKKLSLSKKNLIPDPWESVEEKYPVGNIVLGKVVRFADFGAFIELEPGVDGLAHISEISYKRINKPSDVLKIGDEVKAKIIHVNKENKKISLSIKEAE